MTFTLFFVPEVQLVVYQATTVQDLKSYLLLSNMLCKMARVQWKYKHIIWLAHVDDKWHNVDGLRF
jgi:hypothetical protein